MKNLANCKPSEFLKQTNKIRKSVQKWLDVTDIINIRKRMPEFETAPSGTSAEERVEIIKRNAEKQQEQAKQNIMDMLDAMLDKHPDETLEVLALCCFVEPKDVDNHPMSEYLASFLDLVNNKEVLNFFTLLAQLAQKNT